jgi:hypothetical protein
MKKKLVTLILISIFIFPLFAQQQKWEYFVFVVPGPLQMSAFSTTYLPSVTTRFWTFPRVSAALNTLGADGWEMMSANFDSAENYVITLKRPN